jgi:hypothetical protein
MDVFRNARNRSRSPDHHTGFLRSQLPWMLRGVVAGFVGTAAMSAAYGVERRLRQSEPELGDHDPTNRRPLDYDDSLVPGQIVANILHLPSVTARGEYELGMALRWGYGSAFGVAHGALRRTIGEPYASLVFGGMLMSATLSLFPLLGRTPPPWRWGAAMLATAFGTHAVYVGTVAAVDSLLGGRGSQS